MIAKRAVKKSSRTDYHLLIIRFSIDKYVKASGKKFALWLLSSYQCIKPSGRAVRPVDTVHCHCRTDCIVGRADSSAVFDNIASRNSKYIWLSIIDKFKPLMCPISAVDCKQGLNTRIAIYEN